MNAADAKTLQIRKGETYWVNFGYGISRATVLSVNEQQGARIVTWRLGGFDCFMRHTESLENFYNRIVRGHQDTVA